MDYESSLCSGCGNPRLESFDPAHEERYKAEALECHACATKDRKTRNDAQDEATDMAGRYYVVTDDPEWERGEPWLNAPFR